MTEFLFILITFFTNIVQTVTGFAGTVLAMPASIHLVGYDTARPVLNAVAGLVSLFVVIFYFKQISWRRLAYLIIFIGLGFAVGYLIHFIQFDMKWLLTAYGVIICLIAVLLFFFSNWKIPAPLQPILLILAGILHFLFTSGGPLAVLYAMQSIEDKDEFRATLSCLWVILNTVRFCTDVAGGSFSPYVWMLTALTAVTAFAALAAGKWIVKKLNKQVFMKITYVLLFLSGLSAIF